MARAFAAIEGPLLAEAASAQSSRRESRRASSGSGVVLLSSPESSPRQQPSGLASFVPRSRGTSRHSVSVWV